MLCRDDCKGTLGVHKVDNKMRKKPIVYLGGPGYSYDQFSPTIDRIEEKFNEIIRSLFIRTPSGENTVVRLSLEVATPDEVRAFAGRTSRSAGEYRIRVTAGFFYRLWLASRVFMEGRLFPEWISKIKVKSLNGRSLDRRTVISDCAYEIILYYVLFHELSHVLLGHCDYIIDELDAEGVSEFDAYESAGSEEIIIRRSFEAEADRMAGDLTAALYEDNVQGLNLNFPSRAHSYEFYVYAISSVFVFFKQNLKRKLTVHPSPLERQYVVCSALCKLLDEKHPRDQRIFVDRSFKCMVEAANRLGISRNGSMYSALGISHGMAFVDDVTNASSISSYAHSVERISDPTW